MTRYVVQISRWYEVEADDEDLAEVEALAEDESEDRQPPTFIVTNLDEIERPLITLQPDESLNWECERCKSLTSTMLTRCYCCDTPRGAGNSGAGQ